MARRITQADYRAAGRGLQRDCAEDARRFKKLKLKVGETWKVHDVRKGDLTLTLTEIGEDWAQGEIVEGKVRYASTENNFAQRQTGMGTKGDVITVSFTLCQFIKKVRLGS